MRKIGVVILAAVAGIALGTPAGLAAETFIPKGNSYSPDRGSLPELNSRQDRINLQADIFESEIYAVQHTQKIHDNEFSRFMYSQNLDGSDFNRLDY